MSGAVAHQLLLVYTSLNQKINISDNMLYNIHYIIGNIGGN